MKWKSRNDGIAGSGLEKLSKVTFRFNNPKSCADAYNFLDSCLERNPFDAKYKLLGRIEGKYSGGDIFRARLRENPYETEKPMFAVKMPIQRGSHIEVDQISKELELLKRASENACIIKMVDHFKLVDKVSGLVMPYIIMEYAKGDNLCNLIRNRQTHNHGGIAPLVTDAEARECMWRLLTALHFVHTKLSASHRDIKPDNILLLKKAGLDVCKERDQPEEWSDFGDPCSAVISDFGHSGTFNGGPMESKSVGTLPWLAPEIALGRYKAKLAYTQKVDMWSLGLVLFFMVTGKALNSGAKIEYHIVLNARQADKYIEKNFPQKMTFATELLRGLLRFDPDKRLSADVALKCKWFEGRSATGDSVTTTNELRHSGMIHLEGGQQAHDSDWYCIVQ